MSTKGLEKTFVENHKNVNEDEENMVDKTKRKVKKHMPNTDDYKDAAEKVKEKVKKHDTVIANETIVTDVEKPMISINENKTKPLHAFTKEQVAKRTLSPEHLAKLKAGRDAKRAA